MNTAYGKGLGVALAALVLTSIAVTPVADAAGRYGGGGRHGGGGGGQVHARTQINNSRADVRTNHVRSTSVNNVNVNRNVNVNVDRHGGCCCCGGWDHDYHPVATAAAVTATVAVTSAVVGSIVRSVPPSCVPVNYGGMIYQQCGSTWYLPQGAQYIVVNPPY